MRSITDKAIARWRAAIPEELWPVPHWLLWVRKPKPGKPGKFDKVPWYACGRQRCGTQGSAEDRQYLVEFGDALAAYQRGRYDGIGLAVLPDSELWALDLDDCIVDGVLSALAQRVVDSGTYCERSPSGSGIRALFAEKIGCNKKNHSAGVEVFGSTGFVTLTGHRVGGDGLLVCPPALLADLLAIVHSSTVGKVISRTDAPPANPELANSVKLPMPLWRKLLNPYPAGADRSAAAFTLAMQLRCAGITREQALELLALPEPLAPALDRRGGDIASAREWMWRYCVLPAFQEAQHGG